MTGSAIKLDQRALVEPIDLNEGVIWACRLLLYRDPANLEAVEEMRRHCDSPAALRNLILRSREYSQRFERTGHPTGLTRFPVDLKQGVIWAYRLYFQQEPDEKQIAYQLNRVRSIEDIRACFLLSREFELQDGYGIFDLQQFEVLHRFAPFCEVPADPCYFNDFLGSKTRLAYLPTAYGFKSGTVEGPPNSRGRGMHGIAEWVGTLRSILEARGSLVVVELGAGWAPWLVAATLAAKKLGVDDIRLIGVEGSADHLEYCRQHFLDNGLDPDAHQLHHAVVGASDGVARFPKLLIPCDHYGANAVFDDEAEPDKPGLGEWEEIKSLSLETVLQGLTRVDIIHCDIQGSEVDVLTSAFARLNECVRRVVIGTHSRKIEADLLELFSTGGWIIEHEQSCVIKQHQDGSFILARDGEQIWRNPRVV